MLRPRRTLPLLVFSSLVPFAAPAAVRAQCSDDERAQAAPHVAEGREALAASDARRAREEFERAFILCADTWLLPYVALARSREGDVAGCRTARLRFEEAGLAMPEEPLPTDHGDEAERARLRRASVTAMREQCAEGPQTTPPPARATLEEAITPERTLVPPARTVRRPDSRRVDAAVGWPEVLLGSGLAGAVAGAALLIDAYGARGATREQSRAVEHDCATFGADATCAANRATHAANEDRVTDRLRVGWSAAGVGIAAAAVGALLWAQERDEDGPVGNVACRPGFVPNWAVTCAARF